MLIVSLIYLTSGEAGLLQTSSSLGGVNTSSYIWTDSTDGAVVSAVFQGWAYPPKLISKAQVGLH